MADTWNQVPEPEGHAGVPGATADRHGRTPASRRRVAAVVDVALLASVLAVVVTGFLVDRLDLHEFPPHAWAGYAMAALVIVHVALHRRALRHLLHPAPSRPRRTGRGGAASPAPPGDEPQRDLPRRRLVLSLGAGATGVLVGWFARARVGPSPYDGGDVGLFYHRESSLGLGRLVTGVLDQGGRPAPYKRVGDEDPIDLPPVEPPAMTLAQAIAQRRSLREYAGRVLTGSELAWFVHAAAGITSGAGLRSAPSAGALYPIETYVAVHRVEGVEAGLYHLDVRARGLEPIRRGSVGGDLLVAGLGQDFLRTAPVVFILTGLFQRTRWKYRDRHYRYVCWEAGHIAQNLYLAAEAAGCGACVVGAFLDDALNDLLRIDGRQEAALGLIAVGPR